MAKKISFVLGYKEELMKREKGRKNYTSGMVKR
jgi:hypothetical protein